METKKVIIAGLGNPGKQYEMTRHNAGFIFLDMFCDSISCSFSNDSKCPVAKTSLEGKNIIFIKPYEYMNLSGNAVSNYSRKNGIPPENILVLHDEIDFPFGRVKIKFSGGHVGHNGLKEIVQKIGSNDFHRIRIGVGKPIQKELVADYVLSRFNKEEFDKLGDVYKQVESLIYNWLRT